MRRACLRAALASLALVSGTVAPAAAQARPPRFEISAGGLFVGGYTGGQKDADLTANQTGGAPYTLFKTESRIESSAALEARVGYRVSRTVIIEGGVLTSRPQLSTRLTADVEGAPDITALEDLSVYVIDAAVMVTFGKSGSAVTPFVRAGAGYLRELHDDNALVKTGQAYHVGGGVTFWLNRRQTFGARADARVYMMRGGIDLDGGTRTQVTGGGAVVFAF